MSGIFLVEDDDRLSELMRDYLTGHGYPVTVQRDGARAVETLQHIDPAVVLLDLQLPGRDGFEVCKEIRAHYRGVIMMLTARTDDIDQVLGLELGADDYIAKPVQPRVLLARIRAHLRRKTVEPCAGALCFGEFRIERAAREVVCQGRTIEMTTAEFDLLWCLAKKGGEVLSRDALMRDLRGIEFDGLDRSIDARISRLRRKLGDNPEQPERIKTVRGRGYLFSRSAWG